MPAAAVSVAGACKTFGSLLDLQHLRRSPARRGARQGRPSADPRASTCAATRPGWIRPIDQAKAAGCVAITVVTEAPTIPDASAISSTGSARAAASPAPMPPLRRVLREGGTGEAGRRRRSAHGHRTAHVEDYRGAFAQRSSLPVILKGISTAEDARLAVEHWRERRSTSPTTAAASSIARVVASRCCRKSSMRSPAGRRSSWMAASIAAPTC